MSENTQEQQKKIITDVALLSILSETYKTINEKLNDNKLVVCINKKDKHWWIGYLTEIEADEENPPIKSEETGTWIVGVTDTGIKDNDFDYCIENVNGTWFIGKDTDILAEGRSLKKLVLNDNNQLIATYSDNTEENVGTFNLDISADFLTQNGFGNIRFYEGKFQYCYNGEWIDIVVETENTIWSLTPQCMTSFYAEYNAELGYNTLMINEPSDTIVDGQTVCFVEEVVIIRKKDSVPQSISDGDEVITIHRRDFGSYKNTPYIDTECNAQEDDVWYYRAFPVSTMGVMNELEENNITSTDFVIYGFVLNQNESDPNSMITYIERNKNYSPAYMDFEENTFNYGDWGNAWFIKELKPCMLKYDGTVDYELDKNDYTQKADGSGVSDISNTSYEGNAMVGIPRVYWKIIDNEDGTANVYLSNKKVDSDYHCWSHIDNNGHEIDYCYIPIYMGSVVNSTLRSLSGVQPTTNLTGSKETTYALNNNQTENKIWNTEVYSDRILVTLLTVLIGKTTDSQSNFGNGNIDGSILKNGTMDKCGLFYGYNTSSNGVKMFGVENIWVTKLLQKI